METELYEARGLEEIHPVLLLQIVSVLGGAWRGNNRAKEWEALQRFAQILSTATCS